MIYNDIDAEELKKPTVHVDMPVHADVKDLLEKMEMVLEVEAVSADGYVIYNDIDAEELKKPTVHVDMPVHADVKDLLEKMEMVLEVEAVSADGGPKDKEAVDWWISRCQQWKEKYPVVLPKHYEAGDDKPANIYAAIKEISRRAEEDQITRRSAEEPRRIRSLWSETVPPAWWAVMPTR